MAGNFDRDRQQRVQQEARERQLRAVRESEERCHSLLLRMKDLYLQLCTNNYRECVDSDKNKSGNGASGKRPIVESRSGDSTSVKSKRDDDVNNRSNVEGLVRLKSNEGEISSARRNRDETVNAKSSRDESNRNESVFAKCGADAKEAIMGGDTV
ncbi:hypothetical protein ColLi_10603 [Colletotrichum liriopes]|uniref:Uncharacterized protein n=1 Tax=Colletotrichum liriopes TaxID=708192 RepID=A0AA37GW29_9PEZI|nr:hypothetical protein ColLi_10603 [Colletotrichum liriopes]